MFCVIVDIFDGFGGRFERFFRLFPAYFGVVLGVSFGGRSFVLGVRGGEESVRGRKATRVHSIGLLAVGERDAGATQQAAVLHEHPPVQVLRNKRYFTPNVRLVTFSLLWNML